MTRRFEVGPLLVALAAVVLLVSLFLDWYGPLTAWDVFEITEVLLLVLALAALVVALGQLVPEVGWIDRRYMPAIVLATTVLVVAVLVDPPPAAGPEEPTTGAWLALAAVLLMLSGTVLSFGKVSFAVEHRRARRLARAGRRRRPPAGHDGDRGRARGRQRRGAACGAGPSRPRRGTRRRSER